VNSYSSIPARSEIFLCSTLAEHQMPSTLGTTPFILLDSTLGSKTVMFVHDFHLPSSMGESPATVRTCYSSSIDNWVDCASSVDCCSTLTTGFYGVDVKHSVDIVYLPVSTLSYHSRGSLIFSTQFVKVCALSFVVIACFGAWHVFFFESPSELARCVDNRPLCSLRAWALLSIIQILCTLPCTCKCLHLPRTARLEE
jgi:hypothetical protein